MIYEFFNDKCSYLDCNAGKEPDLELVPHSISFFVTLSGYDRLINDIKALEQNEQ